MKNSKNRLLHPDVDAAGSPYCSHNNYLTAAQEHETIRYQVAARAAGSIIWDWDFTTNTCWCNQNYYGVFGYSSNNILTYANWIERIHPQDRTMVTDSVQKEVANEHPVGWQCRFRYLKADGTPLEVHAVGYIIHDKHGIASAFIGTMKDITNDQVSQNMITQFKIQKQHEIAAAVLTAQECERTEIGMELHDNVNQILGATKLYIDEARKNGNNRDYLLQTAVGYIMTAIEEIRQLSRNLVTPLLEESGLTDSIQDLIAGINKVHPVKISCKIKGVTENLYTDKFKLNVFRIIQEQLNNILKHARAEVVEINIKQTEEQLFVSVKDDGVGFNNTHPKKGLGIVNIKNRAELFKGDVLINSLPGKGCTLSVSFRRSDLLIKPEGMITSQSNAAIG